MEDKVVEAIVDKTEIDRAGTVVSLTMDGPNRTGVAAPRNSR